MRIFIRDALRTEENYIRKEGVQGSGPVRLDMAEQAKKSGKKEKFKIDAATFRNDKRAESEFLKDEHPDMLYQTAPVEERVELMTSVWHLYYQGSESEKALSLKAFNIIKDFARAELERMRKKKTYKDEDVVRDLEMTYLYMGYHCGDKEMVELVKGAAINYTDDMIHEMANHLKVGADNSIETEDYLHDSYVKVLEMLDNYIPRTKFGTYGRAHFKGGVIMHAANSRGMRKKDYIYLNLIEEAKSELFNEGYRNPNEQMIADRMMLFALRRHWDDPSYKMKKHTPDTVYKVLNCKRESVTLENVENNSALSDDISDYVPGIHLEKEEEIEEFRDKMKALPALEKNVMLAVLTSYDVFAENQDERRIAMFEEYDAGKPNRSISSIQKKRERIPPISFRNECVRLIYPELSDDMIRKIINSAHAMIRSSYKRSARNRRYHLQGAETHTNAELLHSMRLEKEAGIFEESILFESLGE